MWQENLSSMLITISNKFCEKNLYFSAGRKFSSGGNLPISFLSPAKNKNQNESKFLARVKKLKIVKQNFANNRRAVDICYGIFNTYKTVEGMGIVLIEYPLALASHSSLLSSFPLHVFFLWTRMHTYNAWDPWRGLLIVEKWVSLRLWHLPTSRICTLLKSKRRKRIKLSTTYLFSVRTKIQKKIFTKKKHIHWKIMEKSPQNKIPKFVKQMN